MTPPAPRPGQGLGIASVPNLRDLGGWTTPDGTVRRGVLFRSAEFGGLAGDDLAAFDRLGIATVFDFRTEAERVAQPNTLPDHVAYVPLDVMADSANRGPAMLVEIVSDPKVAEEMLGGGRAFRLFRDAYREIIELPISPMNTGAMSSVIRYPQARFIRSIAAEPDSGENADISVGNSCTE